MKNKDDFFQQSGSGIACINMNILEISNEESQKRLEKVLIFNTIDEYKNQQQQIKLYKTTISNYKEFFIHSSFILRLYTNNDGFKFRYSDLIAYKGFSDRYNRFVEKYDLHDHYCLFLYLIAEIADYRMYFDGLFQEGISESKEYLTALTKDIENIQQLKGYVIKNTSREKLEPSNLSREFMRTHKIQLKLSFSKVSFSFSTPEVIDYLLSNYCLQNIWTSSDINKESVHKSLPHNDNYYRYYQQELVKALNNFIKEKTTLRKKPDQKTEIQILNMIYDFFVLIDFHFIDAYGNLTLEKSKAIKIIKTWLIRSSR